MLVGLPGAGKSAYLERYGILGISSDEVRRLLADDPTIQTIHRRVFATMRYLVRQRLAIGREMTYVDATHVTPWERRPYVRLAQLYDCEAEAVFFNVPLEICLERNRSRARQVPEEAIRTMAERLKAPSVEEGFTRVIMIE